MTYVVALILGIAVGIGLEFWFLSPKMLARYQAANKTVSSNWEAAKRMRKTIDERDDKEAETEDTDSNSDIE